MDPSQQLKISTAGPQPCNDCGKNTSGLYELDNIPLCSVCWVTRLEKDHVAKHDFVCYACGKLIEGTPWLWHEHKYCYPHYIAHMVDDFKESHIVAETLGLKHSGITTHSSRCLIPNTLI